MAWNTEK